MAKTLWAIDPAHSEVQFKVRHLMITNVTGSFRTFDGSIETDGNDLTTAQVRFSIDIDSIDTNNPQRDGHLRTADFFDHANHPQLTFVSDHLESAGGGDYHLHGTLTMRGVSKPITLDVEASSEVKDGYGREKVGFSVSGKVKRTDFGVNFGALADAAGSVLLSDDVKIIAEVQFVKQAAEVAA